MGLLSTIARVTGKLASGVVSAVKSSVKNTVLGSSANMSMATRPTSFKVRDANLSFTPFTKSISSKPTGMVNPSSVMSIAPTSVAAQGGYAVKSSTSSSGFLGNIIETIKEHPISSALGVAGAAAAAYGVEQAAEKLGVRGGAGFIGKRPRKKKKKVRRYRRSRNRSSKRVAFVTKDGRRVSFTPRKRQRAGTSVLRFRRKRGRRGRGVSKTELRSIRALLRRSERD